MKTQLLPWWIFLVCGFEIRTAISKGLRNMPTTVQTFRNDTVLLPCYEDGPGTPVKVLWYRNKELLVDSSEPPLESPMRLRMLNNRSLEVSRVQPEDAGEYVCEVIRPAPWGHVIQMHAIELMRPPSISPIPESRELEVDIGKEVDMACLATGVPTPIVSWWFKDEELQLLDNRQRLRFQADSRNLSGRYTCIANNGVGEPASVTINLRIRHKPEIEARSTWLHASPGIRAQLNCRVTAWPEAKVDWFFEDRQVPYSSRIVKHCSGSEHSLIIRHVKILDYGYYICRATNAVGSSEGIIELSGVANPAVLKESCDASGTSCYFIWEVDSYSPIIEYQFWFRKRTKDVIDSKWHKLFIPSGSDAVGPMHARSFNLTGLTEATHYEAHVSSRNRFGWSRPSTILRFATRGADSSSVNDDEHPEAEVVPEEKDIPVVELAAISQHSLLGAKSNGASKDQGSRIIFAILAIIHSTIIIQKHHITIV